MELRKEAPVTHEHYDVILEDVDGSIRPRKIKAEATKKASGNPWQFATVAGEVGFDIALPMVLGVVVGGRIDAWWGTRPKATLILFFVGILFACASLIRIVRDAVRKR
jgi:predicted F0F1-ATPase subunit